MSRLASTLSHLARPNIRSFTRGQVRMVDRKVVEELNTKQAKFQESNEPVYMVGINKIHFYVATAFGLSALAGCVHGIYSILQ